MPKCGCWVLKTRIRYVDIEPIRVILIFECLFAFAKSNLYDHGVLVLVHCASASVSRMVFDWAHTYDFYMAEDWFGMADLDLPYPVDPFGLVSNYPSPSPFLFCFSFHFFRFLSNRFLFFRLANSISRFLFMLTPF